jgi:hypothetical protein
MTAIMGQSVILGAALLAEGHEEAQPIVVKRR